MDFTSALDTSAADFEPPKLLPEGEYIVAVTKQHTVKESQSGEWDMISYPCKIVGPTESVDPDELEDYGSVSNEPTRVGFMYPKGEDEKNGQARCINDIKSFVLRHCQADVEESASLGEVMAAAVNHQFMASIRHRVDKNDPTKVYAEIQKTAPLD